MWKLFAAAADIIRDCYPPVNSDKTIKPLEFSRPTAAMGTMLTATPDD